ncbi:MAG: YdcF family protein [Cytophagales bacterium]|nr:YdcF family protein [Cytophagales bacterium]
MRKKRFLYMFLFAIVFLCGIVFLCDSLVSGAAKGKLYTDVEKVPFNRAGLLLGTAKYVAGGRVNLYYTYRIQAAVRLVQAGKIKYVIVSGDNSTKDYNEPEQMRTDLVEAGIDSSAIFLDYAGFRTFDSVVRLREIFSQQSVTVISQKFHNERAVFIASKEGIDAVGYNARDVSLNAGFWVQLREKLARVKVFADYLFGKQPKFLGEKVPLPED